MSSRDLGVVALRILGLLLVLETIELIVQAVNLYSFEYTLEPGNEFPRMQYIAISQFLAIGVRGAVGLGLIFRGDRIGKLMFPAARAAPSGIVRWEVLSVALTVIAVAVLVRTAPTAAAQVAELFYYLGGDRRPDRSVVYTELVWPAIESSLKVLLAYLIFTHADRLAQFWDRKQRPPRPESVPEEADQGEAT
jgi:hypothetical protein